VSAEKRVLSILVRRALLIEASLRVALGVSVVVLGVPFAIPAAVLLAETSAVVGRLFRKATSPCSNDRWSRFTALSWRERVFDAE
jgi:hypothetical protein